MTEARKSITIKEIAKRVGVSTTTVSSVLNKGKIIVSPGTQKKILETTKELGYRPSRKAKQLRMQGNRIIAFQIDSRISADDAWRPTVLLSILELQGICAYAYARGYNVIIIIPEKGKDLQEIEKQIINENSVDGIILSGWKDLPEAQIKKVLSEISGCNIPIVTMDYKIYEMGIPSVSINLKSGIKKALLKLQQLGHKYIGYIGGTGILDPEAARQRFDIIKDELANFDLMFMEDWIINVSSEVDSYRKTAEMFRKNKSYPDCIIYHGDHMAMAGIKAMADLKIKVPDDISIISFDNAPYTKNAQIPIASIAPLHYEQGVMLAKQLIDKIEYPDVKIPGMSVIDSDFVERASLGHASKSKKSAKDIKYEL